MMLDSAPAAAMVSRPLAALKERQRNIVEMVLAGMTNHEISLEARVSQSTVAYELTAIYIHRELKVAGRMQLMVRFSRAQTWYTRLVGWVTASGI